jgi:hypothetical protein
MAFMFRPTSPRKFCSRRLAACARKPRTRLNGFCRFSTPPMIDPDREPSLAAPDAHGPASQSHWADGDLRDLEEGLGDDEPSLGWTADGIVGMPLHPGQVDVEGRA